MSKAPLLLSVLLISSTKVFSQCITDGDIIINETSIAETTRNLIEGSTRFSLDLLRTLNDNIRGDEDARGLFFSPHTIWSALVMTYMGAQGATEQEMRNVLGIGDSDKLTTWKAFRNICNFNSYKKIDSRDANYNSANRIYFQDGTTFKNCIREMMDNEIEFLNFKSSARESRETINTWVEKQTQRRIKRLIPPGGIDSLTNMVIVNAIYFKGAWLKPFESRRTKRRRFTTSSKHEIFVRMMSTTGRFPYGKSEELHCYAIELPYTGNSLSMIILLPNNRNSDIETVSNNLTPENLKNLLSAMYPQRLFVSIPKFKLKGSFELSSTLSKLGLRTLFDPRHVDLSGFTGIREFTVDAVHHKSFINVNEQGTEAAAATFTKVAKRGPAKFIADYPFIYFIKDNLSHAILFLGTVQKPPEHGGS